MAAPNDTEPRMTTPRRIVVEYFIEYIGIGPWVDMETVREDAFGGDEHVNLYGILSSLVDNDILREKTRRKWEGPIYVRLTRYGKTWYKRKMQE